MNVCPQCHSHNIVHGVFPTTLKVAGITFKTYVEMDRCKCGEQVLRPWATELLFNKIALYLAQSGNSSPEAFRFMRRQAGLNGAALAELLDLRPETVSRMETGKAPIDRRTWALVAALVEDKVHGSTETVDALHAVSLARRRAKVVMLERIGTYKEQLQELPPGPTREALARSLAKRQSRRVERSIAEVGAVRAAAKVATAARSRRR